MSSKIQKENEVDRATVLEFSPDGSGRRVFASGIRNAVGIAIHPETGDLWGSVNERDGLGDDLVPDYITRIKEGGFYGWPWYYIGANQDPRHPGVRPELRDRVIVPDVLLQSHYASLQMLFYTGQMFPKEYRHEIFAAEHGSWNRAKRTGYKVIRVPLKKGVATGEFRRFRYRICHAAGRCLGTARRRGRGKGWFVVCIRRRVEHDMARYVFR
jgi:glucose/arabinose dehydrogenase